MREELRRGRHRPVHARDGISIAAQVRHGRSSSSSRRQAPSCQPPSWPTRLWGTSITSSRSGRRCCSRKTSARSRQSSPSSSATTSPTMRGGFGHTGFSTTRISSSSASTSRAQSGSMQISTSRCLRRSAACCRRVSRCRSEGQAGIVVGPWRFRSGRRRSRWPVSPISIVSLCDMQSALWGTNMLKSILVLKVAREATTAEMGIAVSLVPFKRIGASSGIASRNCRRRPESPSNSSRSAEEADANVSDNETTALKEFIHRLLDDGSLEAFMDKHADELTPELAEQLHVLAKDALKAGAFDMRRSQATSEEVSEPANRRSRRGPWRCRLLALQGDFQRATTVEEYEAVRTELLTMKSVQRAHRAPNERSSKHGASPPSAATSHARRQHRRSRRSRSSSDRSRTCSCYSNACLHRCRRNGSTCSWTSFPTLDLATARLWLDVDGGIAAALSEIASTLDEAVPVDAPLASDPSRDAAMTDVLARVAAHDDG